MGLLGGLIGAVIDTAMVPVEVVKDAATLGGSITDADEPYTLTRLKKAANKIERAADDAAGGDFL